MDNQEGNFTQMPAAGSEKLKVKFYQQKFFWAAIAVLVLAAAGFWYLQYSKFNKVASPKWVDIPQGLVAGKISKSAAIAIHLPPGEVFDLEKVKSQVVFDPKLEGTWQIDNQKKVILFQPKKALELGKSYRIIFNGQTGVVSKDFTVDEDPKILAIFPNTEADELSEIVISFNRPMVPLSVLAEIEKAAVPVTITPKTEGRFKWAGSRTLKFIPATHLVRSSHYKVEVLKGFLSMDGLEIAPQVAEFTTHPLRYADESSPNRQILYDQPFVLRFNQPVDLEKTARQIEVSSDGKKIDIEVEYGTRSVVLGKDGKAANYLDKTILQVFQEKDRNGRAKFWDNNKSYNLNIKSAEPLEGDIGLNEARSFGFDVPEVLQSLAASSERSALAEPELFDPQGKLIANFYEEIDKDSTKIRLSSGGVKNIEYGEQCKTDENGNPVYIGNGCQKEQNKKQLIIAFNEGDFKLGQNVKIIFSKVVNTNGLTINTQDVVRDFLIYPELKILATNPGVGETGASLTALEICSNSPLVEAEVETFNQMLSSNVSVGKWRWNAAYKVLPGETETKCSPGQYKSLVNYGLRPETKYKIELNLKDQFGQSAKASIDFSSGSIANENRSLSPMQKDYNVTSPDHTKLTFVAENLEYVNLHICKISSQTLLSYINYGTRPSSQTPGQSLGCVQSWQQKIDLPNKYWQSNYFQVDVKTIVGENNLGFFVLSLSHPKLTQQVYSYQTNAYVSGEQYYVRSLINITKLAAQEKKVQIEEGGEAERSVERNIIAKSQGNLTWVSEIGSLRSIAGANVQTYRLDDKKFNLVDSGLTNIEGTARTKPYMGDGAAIVSFGNDQTLVYSQQDKFQWASSYRGGNKTYIYSDRPIYRPGQEVNIKGLYRIGYDANYEIYKNKNAHIDVYDSKNQNILSQDVALSDFGSFNANLVLPKEAALGTYRVEGLDGYYTFEVADYTPAAFKVDANSDKEEYIAGDSAKININANYYFGVPVESGKVEYSVVSQDYYFDRFTDSYFNFGQGWYYDQNPYYGDNYILRDKTTLNSQGKGEIVLPLDFNKYFKDDAKKQSKVFVLQITVKNSMGQSISTQKSFIVHRGEFYLGVNTEKNYLGKNENNKLLLKTVDIKGQAKSVGDIKVTINKIEWNYFKRQEVDGHYYYHSEKNTIFVDDFKASTDEKGNYSKDIKFDKEGEYEILASGKDSKGNEISSSQSLYVYGDGSVEVRPLNNESLDLAVEKSQVEVGQTANVLIKSPYQKSKALIAIERGRILDYKIIDINQNFYNYTFQVKEDYIPNFYVTVLLLSPDPQVKFGQSQFFVNTKEKTLTVEAKPNKNSYLPGEDVVLDVSTKDSFGRGVSAEVSVSVADLSVLALVGNPKKDPVSFFYDGRPLSVTTSSNIKNILTEAEIPTGTKGGGGGDPADLAKKKRGVFKDTAYWKANVKTNEQGYAQVKFTLPDNLTTWQTESLGLTKDTRLGVGYTEFQSKKQLMVVPLKPRFVLPGDEFVVGAQIFNQTSDSQKLDISFASKSLDIVGKKKINLSIEAGKSENVYFKVKAPITKTQGQHDFTISAKNSQYEDTVEQTFPIEKNELYESVAVSNYTTEKKASEFVWLPNNVVKDRGGVTVRASATLIGSLPEALNYMVNYPYGCTEQMLSKISTVAVLKKLEKVPNLGEDLKLKEVEFDGQKYSADDVVKIGLARILSNQTPEGGFAYYPGMKPDFYLTVNVLSSLNTLSEAGYYVDVSAKARAASYALSEFNSHDYYYNDKNTTVMLAAALAASDSTSQQFESIRGKVMALLNNKQYINENIANVALLKLLNVAIDKLPKKNQDQIFKVLESRVNVDARGAYLMPPYNQAVWYYYENPVTDTALFVKAIAKGKRDYVFTEKLIRHLLGDRAKDGSWATTNSTFSVLDAMIDYINFKQETNSHFKVKVSLDGKEKQVKEFGDKTVLEELSQFISVFDFSPDKLSEVTLAKENLNNLANGMYYDVWLKYYLPIDQIAPRDEGFLVERDLYKLDDKMQKNPVSEAKVGDVLKGHLKVIVGKERNLVAVESFIPAGMELVNFNFATEDQSLNAQSVQNQNPYVQGVTTISEEKPVEVEKPGFWSSVWSSTAGVFKGKNETNAPKAEGELPDMLYSQSARVPQILFSEATEYHDDRLMLFTSQLEPGVYEYDYYVRALIPGKFQYLPATAYEMYTPENFGRTQGGYFEIKQ